MHYNCSLIASESSQIKPNEQLFLLKYLVLKLRKFQVKLKYQRLSETMKTKLLLIFYLLQACLAENTIPGSPITEFLVHLWKNNILFAFTHGLSYASNPSLSRDDCLQSCKNDPNCFWCQSHKQILAKRDYASLK